MIKVRYLPLDIPVDITKSDIDELFKNYGQIKYFNIKKERDEIVVYVELDQNEELAIDKLNITKWRGYILYLDRVRGEDENRGQP